MNNGTQAHTTDEPNPWMQPRFLAAAVVVGLIVVLGLVLAVTGSSNNPSHPASAAPANNAPSAVPAPATADANASVCGLGPGSQTIPQAAPKAKWKLRGSVAVPTSTDTFGPHLMSGGVPSCFAHSPTGALFAMLNIQAAMTVLAHEPGRYPISKVLRMIAVGPGRDVLKNAAARSPVATQGTSSSSAQLAGFRIVRYEPASAVVDLAFAAGQAGAAGYVHGQSTMRWEDGDWKLVLAQNGGPFDAVQPIADLTDYVAWRGV